MNVSLLDVRMMRSAVGCLALLAAIVSCAKSPSGPGDPGPVLPDPNVIPTVEHEFRGLWVATVNNIDWPSRTGLTQDQQRAELASILDRAAAARMNAIVFHVRPAGDALYRSAIEPWGAMLSGTQGVDPGWDPLEVAVQQAHARGMELHAWINPFRAGSTSQLGALHPSHIARANPELVRTYGPYLWMDPGEPAVHDRTISVVLDIVQRYDVDAVHLDDYFYPYQERDAQGQLIPFPDSATFATYGGTMSRDDWRRANVNRFLERLYREVHQAKPFVKVGISPFGIWRPGNPAGITGLDAFASIYADSKLWLQSGWLDYLAPQLYWAIDPPQQSFPALLDWWMQQNTRGRHVWPGLATYKLYQGSVRWPVSEILRQVQVTRERQAKGMLFYNTTTTLTSNSGEVAKALAATPFTALALPPSYPWLDDVAPAAPAVTVTSSGGALWAASIGSGSEGRWWLVRYRARSRWYVRTFFGTQRSLSLSAADGSPVDWVVIDAVDAAGNRSASYQWKAPG